MKSLRSPFELPVKGFHLRFQSIKVFSFLFALKLYCNVILNKLVIIKDQGVPSMISIPGSLSIVKLMMMSSTPAKSAGGIRYASQDPFIQSTLSHTISIPICIRSALVLRRTRFCVVSQSRQL